jgi:CDP-glucose 4,6-dehydratase
LEPLFGYLQLAQRLFEPGGNKFAKAWNFGPYSSEDATVGEVAEIAARVWGHDARVECALSSQNAHEAGSLRLDSSLARTELGWKPRWSLPQAVEKAVAWYQASERNADLSAISLEQISAYEGAVRS